MDYASAYGQQIRKHTEKIYDLIGKNTRVYSTAFFHDLRVETKKLNATFQIIKYCSPEFPRKRIFLPYKILSEAAGEVREIQLEESIIRKIKRDHFTLHYLSILKASRMEKKTAFIEVKNKVKEHLAKRDKKILPYSEEITSADTRIYFNSLQQKCLSYLDSRVLKVSTIHNLRKHLKEFMYNIDIITADAKKIFKSIILLQDLIGNWHDLNVINSHLNRFKRKGSLNQRNINQLAFIKSNLSARASQILMRINKEKNSAILELQDLHLYLKP